MQAWRLWSLDLMLSCRNRGRIGAPRTVVSIIHGVGERIPDRSDESLQLTCPKEEAPGSLA